QPAGRGVEDVDVSREVGTVQHIPDRLPRYAVEGDAVRPARPRGQACPQQPDPEADEAFWPDPEEFLLEPQAVVQDSDPRRSTERVARSREREVVRNQTPASARREVVLNQADGAVGQPCRIPPTALQEREVAVR